METLSQVELNKTLSLPYCTAEVHRVARGFILHFDGAEGSFEPFDVFRKRLQEALGVLGGNNNACLHLGLGQTGHHADEVNHELAVAMRNHSEVGVFPLGHGFGKLDVDGVGVRVLVGWLHKGVLIEG